MPADTLSSNQKNETLNSPITERPFTLKLSCCPVGIALIGQATNKKHGI